MTKDYKDLKSKVLSIYKQNCHPDLDVKLNIWLLRNELQMQGNDRLLPCFFCHNQNSF